MKQLFGGFFEHFAYIINDTSGFFYSLKCYVYLIMASYKLDRTAFKAQTLEEASDHSFYYKSLSWAERLRVSAYLNSIAYNYPLATPPQIDKTAFKAKKRNE